MLSGNNEITNFRVPVLYKYGGHISPAFIECGFHNGSCMLLVRDLLSDQAIQLPAIFFRASRSTLSPVLLKVPGSGIYRPMLQRGYSCWRAVHIFCRIGSVFINFIDRKDHRNTCRLCVADCLTCLWHHCIIGSHNDNGDIRDFCTTWHASR